jgi:peptidoglycan-N-acetylglucosamine deacetylase
MEGMDANSPAGRSARQRRRGAGRWTRGCVAQVVVSIVLLIASVTATLAIDGWSVDRTLANLEAPFATALGLHGHPPSRQASVGGQPVAPTATHAAPTATPLPTSTPGLVGEGAGGGATGFPTFTGSPSSARGCPGGQAPKPVSWDVHSAAGYGAKVRNTVALTFDDGPTPFSSPPIISYLEKTHTPATFFVLGQYAKAYPWLIQREAADGFTIGIHTWSHPDMRLLTPPQRAWQFAATIQQLHADLGATSCLWLWRPPYGSDDSAIIKQAGAFGLTTIIWNVDPQDWSRPGTMVIVDRVLSQVRPGSIILMHDGPAAREQTAAALPYILAGLRKRHLTPVSLPQLLLGYQPAASTVTASLSPTVAATLTDAWADAATPDPSLSAISATATSDRRVARLPSPRM